MLVGGVSAAFALAWQWRDIQRAPRVYVTDRHSTLRPAAFVGFILGGAGCALALVDPPVALAAAAVLFLVAPMLALVQRWWLTDFERRTGTRVYRELGRWRYTFALEPRKDTAPAQRTPPHAQPEAARRAP